MAASQDGRGRTLMGLGKITRTGGKVVAALELARLGWLALSGLYRTVRGRRVDEASEDAVHRDEAPPAS
ncbi:MAG: hypothetical protein V4523_14405 [Pseudomonadota bacterium]